jgi:hypothetical protein
MQLRRESVIIGARSSSLHEISGLGRGAASCWSGRRDSNPRHLAWEASTLPTELHPQRELPPDNLITLN